MRRLLIALALVSAAGCGRDYPDKSESTQRWTNLPNQWGTGNLYRYKDTDTGYWVYKSDRSLAVVPVKDDDGSHEGR